MSDSSDIHREVNTDALQEITDSSTTPRPVISDKRLEELQQALIFEEISGRNEDITDQDTVAIPAISKTEEIILEEDPLLPVTPDEIEAIVTTPDEINSRFAGMSPTAVGLFRSGIQHYRNKHSGAYPGYLHASRKRCEDYREEMAHVYGKDFNGRLPLSYTLHGNKAVRIVPDESLDDYTVICTDESADRTPAL